jgi:uncharacterized protein GlcG (DUF336 family)
MTAADSLCGARARAILDEGVRKAGELACSTLTIAVLDAGGHLAALARLDDRWFQVEAAKAKAYAALALRRNTEETGPLLDSTPFWRTVPNLLAGRGAFGLGGVVVRDPADPQTVLGAVGVIGGSGTHDLAVAHAAASALATAAG